MTKITKILIANRGEIACRVMKTARKMGIKTVAVYSDADKKALHTRMADEAVHIGASPAAESYLVIDKIIDACKQTGADAVHPGYGFLSENPEFARRLKAENIIFIGPSPESMEAMGLKDAAKKLMFEAGVPITPGYHGTDQTPSALQIEADGIGYPVLIKAVAGGGGKGMRKVEAAADFIAALESCQREAKSSFGEDRVLIEKYITSPRHIEVQVFGDTHGNVVHMYERDCSLQRRHQKVIEEAPAPGMTDEVRKAMTDAAVKAAQAVDYVGAGTVEFIVDGSGKLRTDGFWFMEMNTRLQVEHPVTEMITGLDLVELQILVAQGEKLPRQDEISIDGHAIEARLYAEDPANDFLPSVGKLDDFRCEYKNTSVRIDAGVMPDDIISIFYDPMIAKICVLGFDRNYAISGMKSALDALFVRGLKSNTAFLEAIFHTDAFSRADISTAFIPNHLENLVFYDESENVEAKALVAGAILSELQVQNEELWSNNPWDDFSGWKLNLPNSIALGIGQDQMTTATFTDFKYFDSAKVKIDDFQSDIKLGYRVELENSARLTGGWDYDVEDGFTEIRQKGQRISIATEIDPTSAESGHGGNAITAPMPGKIIAVNAKSGDTVSAGDPLIIMEAMKMEMTLEAPRDGIVAAVNVSAADLVSDGDVLLEMAED